MDLLPTDEQAELVSVVREFLAAEMPVAQLREPPDTVAARARWQRVAELGWLGLAVPEELGGVGYGIAEEALLFMELGRAATPGPFLATTLACQLCVEAGNAGLLARLVAGEQRVGLGVSRAAVTVGEDRVAGRFVVADGDDEGLVLVFGDQLVALVRSPGHEGVTLIPGIDEATVLADVRLDAAPLLTLRGGAAERLRERATLLSAATLAGVAAATRDISVEYAKVRRQFNTPIGTFQAVSRRCADMAVRAWCASSLVELAALCIAEHRPDHGYQAAAAQTVACDAARRNAADNIQNLGAVGFTAEHDAHFFFKRARVVQTLWCEQHANTRVLLDRRRTGVGLGERPETEQRSLRAASS